MKYLVMNYLCEKEHAKLQLRDTVEWMTCLLLEI